MSPLTQSAERRALDLEKFYRAVRGRTEQLVSTLTAEDMQAQSMDDASPAKWHLAHTTWFFETFVLKALPDYEVFDPHFAHLFNSYYVTEGSRHSRSQRGLLTRPSLAEVLAYRQHVDGHIRRRFGAVDRDVLKLGLHHEQQHQELLVTDVLHLLSHNIMAPAFIPERVKPHPPGPKEWIQHGGGLVKIGHDGVGFAYDNEGPRHQIWLEPFELGDFLVTNSDYLAFVQDGGYENQLLWMDLGWAEAQKRGWKRPLYWSDDNQTVFGQHGQTEIDPNAPVCQVSWFEADAFSRWAGYRLPTEQEWEVVARELESRPGKNGETQSIPSRTESFFREVWQWTASPYSPYPGFKKTKGAIGEYNGKFMSQQYVLRGGSIATAKGHSRSSYRNFFPPTARWQFMGIRLAK